jgi:hypothetical protein
MSDVGVGGEEATLSKYSQPWRQIPNQVAPSSVCTPSIVWMLAATRGASMQLVRADVARGPGTMSSQPVQKI